jgi:transposase
MLGGERSVMDFVVPSRRSKRSHFTLAQKHAILEEYDKCLERGSRIAFSRAVGIADGTIRLRLQQREAGELRSNIKQGNEDHRLRESDKRPLKQVLKENEILKARLARPEAAVDILEKASALLDAMAKSAAATDPELKEPEPQRPEWLMPKPGKTWP